MWTFLLPLLLHAVENAPMLLEDVEKIFAELGAKDGGVAKLASAASVFATLAERASRHAAQSNTQTSPPSPSAWPEVSLSDENGQPLSDTEAALRAARSL